MSGTMTQSSNSDFRNGSINHAKRKLVARALGATLIVALVALIASQQATSSPDTTAKKSSRQVQLDIVQDTSSDGSPSVNKDDTSDASNTTYTTTNGAGNSSDSSVSVTVNGQSVAVPQNGSTQQTITTPAGSTSVNISNNSNSGSNSTSFSSNFSSVNQGGFSSSVDSSFNSTDSSGGSP
jgi:hypothetical protein